MLTKMTYYEEAFMFFDRVSKLRGRNSIKMTSQKCRIIFEGHNSKNFLDFIFAVRVNVSLILKQL